MSISNCLNCHDLITLQVGYWTLDNASNNGTFMEEMEHLLHLRDIDFDHLDRRIMCFPHIINICCQHILFRVSRMWTSSTPPVWQNFLHPPTSSPYERSRWLRPKSHMAETIVRVSARLWATSRQINEVIDDGNAKEWFVVGNQVVMPSLVSNLLRDVRTRWDSVYFMIRRLRQNATSKVNIIIS